MDLFLIIEVVSITTKGNKCGEAESGTIHATIDESLVLWSKPNPEMSDIFLLHGNRILVMKQTNEEPGFWLAALLPHLEPRTEETKSSNLMELSTIAKIFLG